MRAEEPSTDSHVPEDGDVVRLECRHSCENDDVELRVATVSLAPGADVVRLDLRQLAIDGKSYADLSAADAEWLSAQLRGQAAHLRANDPSQPPCRER